MNKEQLLEWLLKQALSAEQSCKAWTLSNPGCSQADYRNGMAYAYYDAYEQLQKLVAPGEPLVNDLK